MNSSTTTRRRFLIASSLGAVAAWLPSPSWSEPKNERPNIILILADDMGYSDIGCYGGEIKTPNLDRLAEDGVSFSQFYNCARCCPTRASLLTGLHPHQAGLGLMTGDLGLPAYRGALNDRCVTIAEVLKGADYRTCASGKWHVGGSAHPIDRGFDQYFGLIDGACSYFRPKETIYYDKEPYDVPTDGSFYTTDAFTDYAVDFLDEAGRDGDTPFFLYLAYTAPHYPIQAWQKDIDKYRGKYLKGWDHIREERYRRLTEFGLIESKWPLSPRDEQNPAWETLSDEEKDWRDLLMATYAAMIDRMDQGIGRLLQQLQDIGADENTLVMFLSDNGGCPYTNKPDQPQYDMDGRLIPTSSADAEYTYGSAWADASSTPFRRYKQHTREGGIATPFIARWPQGVVPGTITHDPGHIIDIMTTCVEVAGATYPAKVGGQPITPMEGKSLTPLFAGESREGHDCLFWNHREARAVRNGKWKLVSCDEQSWELYDMKADRAELDDLAEEQPDLVKQLDARYRQWANRVGVAPFAELQARRASLAKKRSSED